MVVLIFCLSLPTCGLADDVGFSSGDDSTDERKREKSEKHEIEQAAGTGDLENKEDSISLAEECVKYFRMMNALKFDEFESLWEAREAVRKADSERIAVRREMDSSDQAAWDTDFGMYGYHCNNALMLLDNTKLHLKAESVTARTTQGDVTAAKRKLLEVRKAVPEGSGPDYEAIKAYYIRIHECEDLVREFWDKEQVIQEDLLRVRRAWFSLPGREISNFENRLVKWQSELTSLRSLAEEAKRARAKGEDGEWPTERRWEAARRRFLDYLNRDFDFRKP